MSIHIFAVPPPSWMARGHLTIIANPIPSRAISPHRPSAIRKAQPPSQNPRVGGALKLQGQPQSQLQAHMMSARYCQAGDGEASVDDISCTPRNTLCGSTEVEGILS